MKKKTAMLNVASLVLLITSLTYVILFLSTSIARPLTWDEVDYATAAKEGIKKNALAEGTLSFMQMTKLGIAKVKGIKPDVSSLPPESSDLFLRRHFHSVLPVYYWTLFLNDNILTQDVRLKISCMLLVILFVLSVLFLLPKVYKEDNKPNWFILAVLLSFFITSDVFMKSFLALNFHIFFLLVSILFVFALINYLNNTTWRNAVWLGIALAAVVCTLETSVMIFTGALLAIIILKQHKVFLTKTKTVFFSLLIATVFFYPGILKTIEPLKSWEMYAYRIFAMRNAEYKSVSILSNLMDFMASDYLLIMILIIGYGKVISDLFSGRNINRLLLIPCAVGLFYLIIILPFATSITYVLPAIGLLFVGCIPGWIKIISSDNLRIIIFGIAVLYIAICYYSTDFDLLKAESKKVTENFQKDLMEAKNIVDNGQHLLVDGGHIFRYYFDIDKEDNRVVDLFEFNHEAVQFVTRKEYHYIPMDDLLSQKYFTGVMIDKKRKQFSTKRDRLFQFGYKIKELNSYYLFYL
jgi:hypothetical protein